MRQLLSRQVGTWIDPPSEEVAAIARGLGAALAEFAGGEVEQLVPGGEFRGVFGEGAAD
jgi:hypothetical protein